MDLKDYLSYNPLTGLLHWIKKPCRKISVGQEAGCLDKILGYKKVGFLGKSFRYHKVCWYLYYGKWPEYEIDHVNRDKLDNRIENLRDVPRRENGQNTEGYNQGAYFNQSKSRWVAQISLDGKAVHLGYFNSEAEAQSAYLEMISKEDM